MNGVSDSHYDPQWDLISLKERLPTSGDYIKQGSPLQVRVSCVDGSGFLHAVCDQLDAGCFVTVTKNKYRCVQPNHGHVHKQRHFCKCFDDGAVQALQLFHRS